MPAHNDPPQSNQHMPDPAPRIAARPVANSVGDFRRPKPVVTRRHSEPQMPEVSPAPLGFEALLREINSVVELLERIDNALLATSNDLAA